MSTLPPLPREVADALAVIPGLERATVQRRLSDGPTNRAWLVECDDASYVLRLDVPGTTRLGLDRPAEAAVREAAAAAGLTPATVYSDPHRGIHLRQFEAGMCWSVSDLHDGRKLEQLAGILRQLHNLPPAGGAYDPLAALGRYASQLGSDEARVLLRRAESVHTELGAETIRPCLCHNDLVCENIIEGSRLQLIDWEFAGLGDPLFDLAVVIQHHQLPAELAQRLVAAYFEGDASPGTRRRLEQQCTFYQCLLELWNLRVGIG